MGGHFSFLMGISMGKWPDFEYHGGKWLKYDWSGFSSSHPSLGSPLMVWCIKLTSSGTFRSFPTCLKIASHPRLKKLFWDTLMFSDECSMFNYRIDQWSFQSWWQWLDTGLFSWATHVWWPSDKTERSFSGQYTDLRSVYYQLINQVESQLAVPVESFLLKDLM